MNPPSAQRCDCGYDFAAGVVKEPFVRSGRDPSRHDRAPFWSNRPAKALVVIVALAASLLLDRAVESRNLRPGRRGATPLDFPQGLLVVPIPIGFTLAQQGLRDIDIRRLARTLWLLYLALALAILAAKTRGRVAALIAI